MTIFLLAIPDASWAYAYVLTLPQYIKSTLRWSLWAKAMKWARYIGSFKLAGSFMVLKKCVDMLGIWVPCKHSKDNSVLAVHKLQEKSSSSCWSVWGLSFSFPYFLLLLHQTNIHGEVLKLTFLCPLYLLFSVHQTLFPLFILLAESVPKQHWVISFLIYLKHQIWLSSVILAALETACNIPMLFWIPVNL